MKKIRLKFIAHCAGIDFFKPVKLGMNEAAKLFGVQADFAGTEDIDIDEQVKMVKEAIAASYDGIVLTITDREKFKPPIREALGRSIPVIAFNCDASCGTAGHLSLIAQDLYQAGKILGANVSKKIEAKSSVLLTLHSAGMFALEERQRGIQDGLKHLELNWKIMFTGNSARESFENIERELVNNKDISAVLCTGHDDTEAAGFAVERLREKRPCIAAGFDLSHEILRLISAGSLLFTIDQQPYLQGFYPVMQLVQYLRYSLSPANVNVGACIIDCNNVNEIAKAAEAGYR